MPNTSWDGRYVAFMSRSTNLVAGDSNGFGDIFLHDTRAHATSRINVSSAQEQANDETRSSAARPRAGSHKPPYVNPGSSLLDGVVALDALASRQREISAHTTRDWLAYFRRQGGKRECPCSSCARAGS